MNYLIIILLAIVQGLTEFLPISSSGHLVLFYSIFGIKDSLVMISVILHLATLCSLLFVYHKQILQILKRPFSQLTLCIFLSTAATLSLALLLRSRVENAFNGQYLFVGFLITAILLILADSKFFAKRVNILSETGDDLTETGKITYRASLAIGFAQGVALFPGISRSGTTIATGVFSKLDKKSATDYSFLLAIPIIFASLCLQVFEYIKDPVSMQFNFYQLFVGFVVAFIMGVVSIKFTLAIVKKHKLIYFSFYLIALSIFLIFNQFWLQWF